MADTIKFRMELNTDQPQRAISEYEKAIDRVSGKTLGKLIPGFGGLPLAQQKSVFEQLGASFSPSPPPLKSSATSAGIDWRKAGLGLLAAPFSPWVGARALSASGMFGGGAGGGGGLFGIGGFSGFLAAFTALQVVAHSLRFAFEQLKDSIRRGNELFVKSAGLGTSTGTLAHLQNTLGAVGLGPDVAERLMAQGQFSRGIRMSPKEFQDAATLGAGRGVLSREEMQAILNMSVQVAEAWNRTLVSSRLSAELATKLHESSQLLKTFKADWDAMWEAFSATFMKNIGDPLVKVGDFILQVQNKLNIRLLERLGIAIPGPDNKKFGLGQGTLSGRPESGWEKMGLIISGGMGGTDFARQTAHNTKRIADLLQMNKTMNPSAPGSPAYNHLG